MPTDLGLEEAKKANENFEILRSGFAISPVDGRYRDKTRELSSCFSEFALMNFRLLVEVEYFKALSSDAKIIRPLTDEECVFLDHLYTSFLNSSYLRIKEIEKKTNHDVNAVVRFFKETLEKSSMSDLAEFAHIGLTSEDINNLAYAFMLRRGIKVIYSEYFKVYYALKRAADLHQEIPLLARTHGQPASPSTLGWEEYVFVDRLTNTVIEFTDLNILVKFGGATGGHNALNIAKPEVDWVDFSINFIKRLNEIENEDPVLLKFVYNHYTTQIEPHDTYAKLFDVIKRGNTILLDYARDMWSYISMEVFTQKPIQGEDGSSAMPNKVNPIDFENAEGNLKTANVLFSFFADELPISRFQRHLTDSTIIRNFGTAFAHTLIALKALEKGMKKVHANTEKINQDLENNWGVIAEAYQTILRFAGVTGGYDLLKEATRGKSITKEDMHNFIDQVAKENNLAPELVEKMKQITPQNYIGNRNF